MKIGPELKVLDFGLELVNMVIQGFTQAHGTLIFSNNLTEKGLVMIWPSCKCRVDTLPPRPTRNTLNMICIDRVA